MTAHNEYSTIPVNKSTGLEIAIIGMAGRFPGASNVEQFWENIKNGVESMSFFSDEELLESGVDSQLLKSPGYIKAKGVLEDIEYFDAHFFNYFPQDAERMDPQLRIFHECTWEALENAAYNPGEYEGLIGVYAGSSFNIEWMKRLLTAGNNFLFHQETLSLNYREYLCPRISYKFNLKGPSITVNTACSTSLAAVHLACQGLLNGECNMALAGAVTISLPKKSGYLFHEGMIFSPDGHCRAFDASAAGTVFSSGAGVVVLKTLEDAAADRDTIFAVIKGSAINNDGTQKIGFTAPSVSGQASVIKAAHYMAEVEPPSLSYVETHSTGTPVGDSIEIEALTRVFNNAEKEFCPIGSVKTNIGHLETAAGVAGLIKTALSLKYKVIPPSLNFQSPNPEIDFTNTPFYVNTGLKPWETHRLPRRAGVNSFGIGGTNAYVILEEWPEDRGQRTDDRPQTTDSRSQLIILSARTRSALEKMAENLARYLGKNPGINLDDVAYTLQVGRKAFEYRTMAVCSDVEDAIKQFSDSKNLEISYLETQKLQREAVLSPTAARPGAGKWNNIGRLWMQGTKINWEEYYLGEGERPFRIPLPTYPFEGQYYWQLMSGKVPEAMETGISWKVSSGSKRPRPALDTPYESPTNETERALVELWQKYFGIEPIGVKDDFLRLGGDSLKVMIMLSFVQKELGLTISIPRFFQNPTIRGLEEGTQKILNHELSSLEPVEKKDYYRLSPAQKRLYFLQQMDTHSTVYNISTVEVLEGKLEIERLERVFQELIRRHESFRTSFRVINDEPAQRIHEYADLQFEIEHFRLNYETQDIEGEKIIQDFIRAFDLARAPLLRVGLIKLGEQKHMLLVDVHHTVCDGYSMVILINEFTALFAGKNLPQLKFQYKDYTEGLKTRKNKAALTEQGNYWLKQFRGEIPELNLPADFVRPARQSFAGNSLTFEIGEEDTKTLKKIVFEEKVTMFMMLLAVYNIFLAKLSGQEDIIIGTPIAGRRLSELEYIVGMFVNTLSLRNYPTNEKTFWEFLHEVKETTLKAYENQDWQFEDLVDAVVKKRDFSRNPLFDTMFVFRNIDMPGIEEKVLQISHYNYYNKTAKFDLKLESREVNEKLICLFEYCTHLFKVERIELFIEYFKNILSSILSDPGRKISDIKIAPEQEIKELLYEFNDDLGKESWR
jgi:3-oxoacyl-(acyl-carrier-protein) synthase/acyl carrier protein